MKRALALLAVLALAGCGSSEHAKPKLPEAPVLSQLLESDKTVHFALDATVKIDESFLLSHLHQVPPFDLQARGNASTDGLEGSGSVNGEVSGTGRALVYGPKGYAQVGNTWYALGKINSVANLVRNAHWAVVRGPDGKPHVLHGALHLSTEQLESLSGLSIPFGIDGADVDMTLRLSEWGTLIEEVVKPPRSARPLPRG